MSLLQAKSEVAALGPVEIKPLKDFEEIPVPAYQFSIEIDGKVVALFQKISGMAITRAVDPLDVGGMNNYSLEFAGRVSYGHVTFETGLSSSDFFWKWMMAGAQEGCAQSVNFFLIQRRPNPKDSMPLWPEVKRWSFLNAFPTKWSISELSVGDLEKVAIESLELSFDYFELI